MRKLKSKGRLWSKECSPILYGFINLWLTAKFQQAVTEGDYQAVRRALSSSKRYDVEAVDDLGITLLMYAAQSGKWSGNTVQSGKKSQAPQASKKAVKILLLPLKMVK